MVRSKVFAAILLSLCVATSAEAQGIGSRIRQKVTNAAKPNSPAPTTQAASQGGSKLGFLLTDPIMAALENGISVETGMRQNYTKRLADLKTQEEFELCAGQIQAGPDGMAIQKEYMNRVDKAANETEFAKAIQWMTDTPGHNLRHRQRRTDRPAHTRRGRHRARPSPLRPAILSRAALQRRRAGLGAPGVRSRRQPRPPRLPPRHRHPRRRLRRPCPHPLLRTRIRRRNPALGPHHPRDGRLHEVSRLPPRHDARRRNLLPDGPRSPDGTLVRWTNWRPVPVGILAIPRH